MQFDLFDQGSESQPGNRQTDLEMLIEEKAMNHYERKQEARREPTIWEALTDKLGREPTHREACDEVKRILREAAEERAGA